MLKKNKNTNYIEIHPEETFHTIIRNECSRSDRLNKIFSLIAFEVRVNDELISMTNFLNNRIRMQDQIGWFDNNNIGILLPETPHEGALKLAEEIKRRMEELNIISTYHVYDYPSLEWKFK
jgi:hypothetical protein